MVDTNNVKSGQESNTLADSFYYTFLYNMPI